MTDKKMKMKMEMETEEKREEARVREKRFLSTHGELSTFPSSRVRLWKLHRILEL